MFSDRPYLPEGLLRNHPKHTPCILSSQENTDPEPQPLTLYIERCDSAHNLHGTLWGCPAIIPREEAVSPKISGAEKEISVLSLVGKRVCCTMLEKKTDEKGKAVFLLSRKRVQEAALAYLLNTLHEGDIIPAVITSMCPIGAFADIGCGIIALLPIRQISVSRIRHPRERFVPHQQIFAVVDRIDRQSQRFFLSHKELLGTWQENAEAFHTGETVAGTVRGITSYGIFIELAPNLTGLAETDDAYSEGDRVAVLIKSIMPERHKIKLHIVSALPPAEQRETILYRIPTQLQRPWVYRDS